MNNFNNLTRSYKAYGGLACRKEGVLFQGEEYLLKYPANLKEKHLKGIDLSYANDTVCEYLGCHIFELLGMKAQETLLGIASDKLVVLCKDFTKGASLLEFEKIKTSSSRDLKNPEKGDITNGKGTNLNNTLEVIRNSYFFEGINVEEFFWKMFIIDFIIDNSDRNNGNWGLLLKDGNRELAPVYDCGNCLESKWDDEKCKQALEEESLLEDVVWRRKISFYTDDNEKRWNPYKLIKSGEYPICNMVLLEVLGRDFSLVYDFLMNCEYLTEVKKQFYVTTIRRREAMLREVLSDGTK